MAKSLNKSVSDRTRQVIWAKGGGRCYYCNCDLIGDLQTMNADLVKGLVAHIVAESPGGPRGDIERSPLLADDAGNLMLMCHPHHKEIDDRPTRDLYPEVRLQAMKRAHEHRIRIQTAITADKATHMVRFGAHIGSNQSVFALADMQNAVFPSRYPASLESIDLEMVGCAFQDHEPRYWSFHQENLQRQFRARIGGRVETRDVQHYSVFALAPQPLLIELGRQLGDIVPANVFQRHREPSTWQWPDDGVDIMLDEQRPSERHNKIALVLGISASIAESRIKEVLGPEVSIWSLTARGGHNDILKTRSSLRSFREQMRRILRDIKDFHGERAEVCLFPALPVAMAIEIGRVWMPKADLPLVLYDEHKGLGGFRKTIEIRSENIS